jgi:hypothetical protein
MPRHLVVENAILEALRQQHVRNAQQAKRDGVTVAPVRVNWVNAIHNVPRNSRKIYVHAYQVCDPVHATCTLPLALVRGMRGLLRGTCEGEPVNSRAVAPITETNRIHVVLFDMQNSRFSRCLTAMYRILIPGDARYGCFLHGILCAEGTAFAEAPCRCAALCNG